MRSRDIDDFHIWIREDLMEIIVLFADPILVRKGDRLVVGPVSNCVDLSAVLCLGIRHLMGDDSGSKHCPIDISHLFIHNNLLICQWFITSGINHHCNTICSDFLY